MNDKIEVIMLNKICNLAYLAGEAIMKIYQNQNLSLQISNKLDKSPLTNADIISHQIIIKKLNELTPNIPILSEENPIMWKIRKHWTSYWLVDPLDGTKEFINHNDEFTVNIALIVYGKPVLGVVYAPALNIMYSSANNKSWKDDSTKKVQIFSQRSSLSVVVISRTHNNEVKCNLQLQNFLNKIGKYQIIILGSSLKFCLIAEGKAQFYPRFGSTNIWDTGAGHAISASAGAYIRDFKGDSLQYYPRKSFLNPAFCVSSFLF